MEPTDAPVILRLLNEPSFHRYIGDRGVRTETDAQHYIADGPIRSYQEHGYGLNLVIRKEDDAVVGMNGLVNRPELDDVDIGFAFFPEYWRQGYAVESGHAVIQHARSRLNISRIVAIVNPDNKGSVAVLARLGFTAEGTVQVRDEELFLFGID